MTDRKKVLELFEAQKDFMDTTVQSEIERNRKGYATIVIKDAKGNLVPNATVTAEQISHEFRFGANLFMLDELETDEKNETYKRVFAETFNMATLPFYWNATEPERGNLRYGKNSTPLYRRPPIDRCMEYCEQHGIEPREHALAYEQFFPKWLYGASVAETKKELERRYAEIAERYKDKIHTIEVTNEMEWKKGRTPFYDEPDYIEWCFKLAEKYFPANQLVINEHTPLPWEDYCRPTDKYYLYIENALLKGARIDAIGMQYHIFIPKADEYERTRRRYNPQSLYEHMDLYSNFGLPIQVTEITLPAYDGTPEDEEIQAKLIEYLYTVWFSHRSVEQIIYWNLVDGYAHVESDDQAVIDASQGDMTIGENKFRGGLLRFDMTPKPALHTIQNLIKKVWHTHAQLITDKQGSAQFKGFYGNYEVEITVGAQKVKRILSLTKNGKNTFEIIL